MTNLGLIGEGFRAMTADAMAGIVVVGTFVALWVVLAVILRRRVFR
jgi:hypothetical protein